MMNFKCMNKFSIAAVMSFALNMPTKRANAQSLMNLKKKKKKCSRKGIDNREMSSNSL